MLNSLFFIIFRQKFCGNRARDIMRKHHIACHAPCVCLMVHLLFVLGRISSPGVEGG